MEVAKELSTRPDIVERRKNAVVLVETTKMVPLNEPKISM